MDNGQGPDRRINTSEINDETARHADELHNFEQTYNNEAKELLTRSAMSRPLRWPHSPPATGSCSASRAHENDWKQRTSGSMHMGFFALTRDKARDVLRTLHIDASLHAAFRWDKKRKLHALFFALTRDKARDVLRTLHIDASLHAAFRWDKKRKLRSNDLDDFTHAKAALAYCNAFFTERSLRSLITSKHLALDKLYDCHVAATEDEALACASRLVPPGRSQSRP